MRIYILRTSIAEYINDVTLLYKNEADAIAEFEHKVNKLGLKKISNALAFKEGIEVSIYSQILN